MVGVRAEFLLPNLPTFLLAAAVFAGLAVFGRWGGGGDGGGGVGDVAA